jgi:transcriptional regulator with XRE-family HTH domain
MKEGLYYELVERFGIGRQMAEEGLILDVSQQLFEVMEEEGITKAELAKRLGCSKAYITKLLRGPSNMTLRKVAEVFHALGRVLKLKAVPVDEETDWELVKARPGRRRRDAGAVGDVRMTGVRPHGPRKKAASKTATRPVEKKKAAPTRGRGSHSAPTAERRTSRVGSTTDRKKST